MGRIFEVRKATMFARWDRMAKQFTRIGKEIAIAVKSGGPNPDYNPALRRCIQNAKGVNMPKERIEAAIKRASDKSSAGFEEVVYEGYAPFGVALLVETATDNTTRTVANMRMVFNRNGGNLGTSGSVSFLFNRVGIFRISRENLDPETLELELIDSGLQETGEDEEGHLVIQTAFNDFGNMSKALDDRHIIPVSAELLRIPLTQVALEEGQAKGVLELVDKLEQDDDVQHVFHNLK
ncbi:MAG TPA: YebC/PmpR family DNA-binding transcriptional regulator [Chitinophagaceae bacterium]|nr:YebC/PmpR family DNA-binding transcriptional regulator [Chitinophagaceae bacterium]